MVTNASLSEFVGLADGDNETLQNFLDYIDSSNSTLLVSGKGIM